MNRERKKHRQNAIPRQRIVSTFIAAIVLKAVEVACFTPMPTHLILSSTALSSKMVCLDTDVANNVAGERNRETFQYPPRNSVFDTTNVIMKTVELGPEKDPFLLAITPKSSIWHRLTEVSRRMSNGKIGCDVTVEFQNADQGAADLVDKCLIQSKTRLSQSSRIVAQSYIKSALDFFQQYASSSSEENYLFKARIVSSIGNVGQKCPRFHVDHVPLRLVLSLKGPGPVYIPFENEIGVDRKSLNELDDLDTERANSMIIPFGEKGYAEYAGEGEAMLLMGKAWEEGVRAIPHRSPRLKDNEERILLVCDILPKQEE